MMLGRRSLGVALLVGAWPAFAQAKPKVVATFSILGDLVGEGEDVAVGVDQRFLARLLRPLQSLAFPADPIPVVRRVIDAVEDPSEAADGETTVLVDDDGPIAAGEDAGPGDAGGVGQGGRLVLLEPHRLRQRLPVPG